MPANDAFPQAEIADTLGIAVKDKREHAEAV